MEKPKFIVGDVVYYHPIIGRAHTGEEFTVRAVDAEKGLAWLTGKSGCVDFDALSRVPSQGLVTEPQP